MNVLRWRPFGDLLGMQNRINQLFEDDFFKPVKPQEYSSSSWIPSTDIYETKDAYVFNMELPGMSKEDLVIELNNNTLSIKGEKKEEKDIKEDSFHRIERSSGSFSRCFSIPKNVNSTKIEASMKNGILKVKIPKVEEAKTKSIAIAIK